ncbi:unnamed protein product, partial [marine sediment metagenome]
GRLLSSSKKYLVKQKRYESQTINWFVDARCALN